MSGVIRTARSPQIPQILSEAEKKRRESFRSQCCQIHQLIWSNLCSKAVMTRLFSVPEANFRFQISLHTWTRAPLHRFRLVHFFFFFLDAQGGLFYLHIYRLLLHERASIAFSCTFEHCGANLSFIGSHVPFWCPSGC